MPSRKKPGVYHIMGDEGNRNTGRCACCGWSNLPRSIKWMIGICCLIIVIAMIGTFYIWTQYGAEGFSLEGSGLLAILLGPGLIAISLITIVLVIICHERRTRHSSSEGRVFLNNVYNRTTEPI